MDQFNFYLSLIVGVFVGLFGVGMAVWCLVMAVRVLMGHDAGEELGWPNLLFGAVLFLAIAAASLASVELVIKIKGQVDRHRAAAAIKAAGVRDAGAAPPRWGAWRRVLQR